MGTGIYRVVGSSSQTSVETKNQCSKAGTTVLALGASFGLGISLGALISRVGNTEITSSWNIASDQLQRNFSIVNDTLCNPTGEQLQRDCRVANIAMPKLPEPLRTDLLSIDDVPEPLLEQSVSKLTNPVAGLSIPRDCSRVEITLDNEAFYIRSRDHSIDKISGKSTIQIIPLNSADKITLAKRILSEGFKVKLVKKDNETVEKKIPPGRVIDSLTIKEESFVFTTKDFIKREEFKDLIKSKLNSCETEMCALISQEHTDQFKEKLNTWCKLSEYRHK